jgi:hypothetical protein
MLRRGLRAAEGSGLLPPGVCGPGARDGRMAQWRRLRPGSTARFARPGFNGGIARVIDIAAGEEPNQSVVFRSDESVKAASTPVSTIVVLAVRADPEPDHILPISHAQRPVVYCDPRRVYWPSLANPFELQARVRRVRCEQPICLTRLTSNVVRQQPVRLPEAGMRERTQF